MAKNSKLSEYEKGQIDAYRAARKSNREIGRLLNRSKCVINNYVKDPANYGTKKTRGITKKLSDRDTRRICRTASNSTKFCSQIKKDLDLNVSPETIRLTILKNPNLVSHKMKRAPALTVLHKRNRLEFGRRNLRKNWSKVSVFITKGVIIQGVISIKF